MKLRQTLLLLLSFLFLVSSANAQLIIDTFAGGGPNGIPANLAGIGTTFVAVDSSGNVFIADQSNQRIRKVDTSGIITTVAGTGVSGFSGDGGPATSATLSSPRTVAIDSSGNLFIPDFNNQRIRKVNTSGTITTVAGNGSINFCGDNFSAIGACLFAPFGVAVDSSDNLFIVDFSNQRIRKVNASGIITTVAGTGVSGFSGDGGPATSARLANPFGVAVDSSGNLFIADTSNNRVRVVYSPNRPPVASAGGPYSVNEGGTITLSASGSSDPDGDTLTFEWDLNYNGATFVPTSGVTGGTPTLSAASLDGPTDSRTIAVRVSDGSVSSIATAQLNVVNVSPVVGAISAPLSPVAVNTSINTSGSFTDAGTADTHTAQWSWGDASSTAGTVSQGSGSGSVANTHTYTTPGIYTLKLTVTDDDGGPGSSEFKYVVVYDPNGSFVTGGGWINSPVGAYVTDPSLTGKASFGFVSKYQKGANVPTGNTQFQFNAGNLNFNSSTYEWLVVAGARAQFKGTGTINGGGNYGFMLTAIDGEVHGGGGADKFRIKIWNKNNGDAVVYDNQIGAADDAAPITVIGGGSIVIH